MKPTRLSTLQQPFLYQYLPFIQVNDVLVLFLSQYPVELCFYVKHCLKRLDYALLLDCEDR